MTKFAVVFALLWSAVFFFPAQTRSVCVTVHGKLSNGIDYIWRYPK